MRAATPGDPTAVTRRSYNLIAADYAARNAEPRGDFVTWRDAWVADVLAGASPPARAAPGVVAGDTPRGAAAREAARGAAAGDRAPGATTGDTSRGKARDAAPEAAAGDASRGAAAPCVLDAGAGPGQHTTAMVGAGLRAIAFDLSPEMARLARGRGVPVVLGDLRRLPFADEALDGVWSAAALLHVPREDVPATLREWHRATRPGAPLALATASGGTDGWEDPPYETSGERPPPRWFVYHDADGLSALLDDAGWDVESVASRRSHRTWLTVRARRR